MDKAVLVLNSGSSSLKFSVFNLANEESIFSGIAEQLNSPNAKVSYSFGDETVAETIPAAGHQEVLDYLLASLTKHRLVQGLCAVGHRIVHGGEFFHCSTLIDDEVIDKIKACNHLAPLHNPANLLGVEAVKQALPGLPQVAVFDTAFHQTMDKQCFLYALPYEYYRSHGVRRYGFHGSSHRYVSEEAIKRLNLPADNSAVITAHLGNGCSAVAVLNGRSVDSTMGLTPLEGLVMGTRCGDIDPSIHSFLTNQLNISLEEVTEILNTKSGLLGISELSNDMRALWQASDDGNEQAQLAIDIFCFRLAKHIAGLQVSLGRLDGLVFTGGIGENDHRVRAKVLDHLSYLGFEVSINRNEYHGVKSESLISSDQGIPVLVISTQEELVIARDTKQLVEQVSSNLKEVSADD